MENKKLYIPLNIREYNLLSDAATNQGMKISGFVKSLLPIKEETNYKPTIGINNPKRYQQNVQRNKSIKAYFTENELIAITHMANGESLSSFVARRAIQPDNTISLEIQDDDLDFVFSVVEPLYSSIYQYLYNMKLLSSIDQQLLEEILSNLKQSNEYLLGLCDYVRKNRRSIRDARLREFRKLSKVYECNYDFIDIED